jgi:hypothetical protein
MNEVRAVMDKKKRKLKSIQEDKKKLEEDLEAAQRKYRQHMKTYLAVEIIVEIVL